MGHYDEVRGRIRRRMVPLPILFQDDGSIDHAGLARYVEWHIEQGTDNFCLTFVYSQLDFVSREEIVEITRTVMAVVGDEAVFISCTGGGPLHEAVETVQQIEQLGTHATFVHMPEHCLQNSSHCGDLYVRYIRDVAAETSIPLLAVALGVPYTSPLTPMLTVSLYEELCANDQFIGIKDDIYILSNRAELARHFSGRMGITGGGIFAHYVYFHHWSDQGEFVGLYNPQRSNRMFELLDNDAYRAVLEMMEEEERLSINQPDLHWMARNQVVFWAMGFAKSYNMRSPILSATPQQVQAVVDHMRETPLMFERAVAI